MADIISMARSITWKLSGVMVPKIATGSPITMQILNMLLPMILPTIKSVSLRLAATMVVISSGREVPKATMVRAMMRSVIPIDEAMLEALLTTSWLPAIKPARPIILSRNDLPSLYFGFSAFLLLVSRFFLAMAIR